MRRTWIVRFDDGDGRRRAGRLTVDDDDITFVADDGLEPAVTIPRAAVTGSELVVDGLAESVIVTLADGRQVVLDHGVLPAGELAHIVSRQHPPTEVDP